MSGTYGEPGKNPYPIPGIVGQYSNVVNESTGVSQIYQKSSQFQYTSIGTYNPSTKKFTPDPNASLSTDNIKILSDQSSINAIKGASITTATKAGLDPTKAQQLITPNTAAAAGGAGAAGAGSTSGGSGGGLTKEAAIKLKADLGNERSGTRNEFPGARGSDPLVYPITLRRDFQDVIKFSMIKYAPRALDAKNEGKDLSPFAERRAITLENTIGTVILPIPNGITDTNSCDWGSNSTDVFGSELFNIANSFIVGGGEAGVAAVGGAVSGAAGNTGAIAASLSTKFAEVASGTTNMLSRTQGAVQNPNMELLFNGPTLRPFNFTFKLASRSETESKTIRSIIRFFKQGMSPIRTQSQLFLKAPHTFQMQYLHRGEEHKFLNQFKECALQSFSVSYTPEGQYATFQDGAMVSYQITMQFSELEPVFNDDYTNDGKDPSPNIGL